MKKTVANGTTGGSPCADVSEGKMKARAGMLSSTKIIEDLSAIIEKQTQIILDMYKTLSQHDAAEAYDSALREIQEAKDAAENERR